ncbi:hypothetical protein GN316_15415 [Xylophilus sp. Kf1]|nr:hypothetical protein [Xylophilus sp. Kf1]
MKLSDYLEAAGSLSVTELSQRIGVKSPAQVRQWQHGYAGRQPGPKHCVAIERATGGAVRRADLRSDWADIWPELAVANRDVSNAVA